VQDENAMPWRALTVMRPTQRWRSGSLSEVVDAIAVEIYSAIKKDLLRKAQRSCPE
jgi:hypothetical protein